MSDQRITHLTDSKVRVHTCDCPDLSFRRAPIPARRKRLTRAVR